MVDLRGLKQEVEVLRHQRGDGYRRYLIPVRAGELADLLQEIESLRAQVRESDETIGNMAEMIRNGPLKPTLGGS